MSIAQIRRHADAEEKEEHLDQHPLEPKKDATLGFLILNCMHSTPFFFERPQATSLKVRVSHQP
jgi:hypothetical protein